MKTCSACNRFMAREIAGAEFQFVCACGAREPAVPYDRRITGQQKGQQHLLRYQDLIKYAAYDATNLRVKKDCPKCGLDYLTQLRIEKDEIVIYVCKCGFMSNGVELLYDHGG